MGMINIWWTAEDGTELECKMCKHYIPEKGKIKTVCLGCRHEYEAHTDEEAEGMNYPKPDLFCPSGIKPKSTIEIIKDAGYVLVVRCDECKMRDKTKMCHIWGKDVKDDDYCSYGKRKER